jgi:hypothetical protein
MGLIPRRALSIAERSTLRSQNFPDFCALGSRYFPEIDIDKGFPAKPEFLDVLRTSWLLDTSPDRPKLDAIVRGLGYALGLLIHNQFGLEWCLVEDTAGGYISMIGESEAGEVSVPPFSYVEKKGDFPNAEVFVDLFRLVAEKMKG